MRTYYVTVWGGDGLIEPYTIALEDSEKANAKTFAKKLNLEWWHTIISWSLEE